METLSTEQNLAIIERDKHRRFVHDGVKTLAALDPDRAAKRNGQGFDAADTHKGHELARKEYDRLTEYEVVLCNNLCVKYSKQLDTDYWTLNIEMFKPLSDRNEPPLAVKPETSIAIASVPDSVESCGATHNDAPVPVDSLTLTYEQSHALDLISEWLDDLRPERNEFKLGGYAGTGKTTIIKYLDKICRDKSLAYEVTAFTGKACAVLKRKNVSAITSHSMMYRAEQTKEGWKFWKRDILESRPDLVIIDEASMYSTELYNDLKSFKVKMLFVGDPGQLEPVGDNPNLMLKPDFVLSKIHRQAEQSPIIQFAHHVREGGHPNYQDKDSLKVKTKTFTAMDLIAQDQVICAKNKTRSQWNDRIRLNMKGFAGTKLQVGEKLIVLRNNQAFWVFNGLILFVTEILGEKMISNRHGPPEFKCWMVNARDEIGKTYTNLPIWQKPFDGELEKGEYPPRKVVYADYGYVVTCHKSQGSEWDKVLVIDEWMPPTVWDMKRWRYTAITRAAKELTYCV